MLASTPMALPRPCAWQFDRRRNPDRVRARGVAHQRRRFESPVAPLEQQREILAQVAASAVVDPDLAAVVPRELAGCERACPVANSRNQSVVYALWTLRR